MTKIISLSSITFFSFILWIIYSLIFFSSLTNAKPVVDEKFEFYVVSPNSTSELVSMLDAKSPIKSNGKVYYGHTEYKINWHFWWEQSAVKCHITKVETTLKLIYTMPKLATHDREVQSVWKRWYPHLLKHEKHHGQLAKDTASKITGDLLSMKPQSNCKQLSIAANKLASELMTELEILTKRYDVNTNHGETEQAWLYSHL